MSKPDMNEQVPAMRLYNNKNALMAALPHLLVWGILFLIPLLFSTDEIQWTAQDYLRSYLPLLFSAIIFYLNYYFLVDKFLFNNKKILFIIINIAVIALCMKGMDIARIFLGRPVHFHSPSRHQRSFVYSRTLLSFILTLFISVAIRATKKWIDTEREKREIENEKLKSELTHLRYQIQPHFFFNSLNNIYALVDISGEEAKHAIHTLGKMMRYVLYETQGDTVSLYQEVEFLKNYVRMMEIRFPNLIQVNMSFPDRRKDIQIAPLLFVPLVENAFKHGTSSSAKCVISLRMEASDQEITFETENNNFPKRESDISGSGIGIDNLKKRLKLLYPGRAVFVQELQGEIVFTKLRIQL